MESVWFFTSMHVQYILAYPNLFYPNARFIWNKVADYVILMWFTMCISNVLCQQLKCLQIMYTSCSIIIRSLINILDRFAEGEKWVKLLANLVLAILQWPMYKRTSREFDHPSHWWKRSKKLLADDEKIDDAVCLILYF